MINQFKATVTYISYYNNSPMNCILVRIKQNNYENLDVRLPKALFPVTLFKNSVCLAIHEQHD